MTRNFRDFRDAETFREWRELRRLRGLPRYVPGTTGLISRTQLEFVDAASLISAWISIFHDRIYDVEIGDRPLRILDCGANIGLAVIRWKQLNPAARIDAFEADPQIAAVLRRNLESLGIQDVTVHAAAVWDEDGSVPFHFEGADAGRIEKTGKVSVPAVRLRRWLTEPIDLLKLDIEGAELTILEDLSDVLGLVQQVFVEYHRFTDEKDHLSDVLELLRAAGFRTYPRTEFCSTRPFMDRAVAEEMDLRVNIFATKQSATSALEH